MFTAILDTCVLWPSLQRDFLLSLAIEGLYRPLWSSAILDELAEHEPKKLISRGMEPAEAEAKTRHLLEMMERAFEDACVEGWEPLEGTYELPDPDDEHIVAAAVIGGAGAIVTSNLRDFPPSKMPAHIQVIPPATFVLNTVEISPALALTALGKMADRTSQPPRTVDELLDVLVLRYKMTDAVDVMRSAQ